MAESNFVNPAVVPADTVSVQSENEVAKRSWPGWLVIVPVVIVIVAAGYFLYQRFFAKPKTTLDSDAPSDAPASGIPLPTGAAVAGNTALPNGSDAVTANGDGSTVSAPAPTPATSMPNLDPTPTTSPSPIPTTTTLEVPKT